MTIKRKKPRPIKDFEYTPYDVARDDPSHNQTLRPGAMDAYKLPSLIAGQRVPYAGISSFGSGVHEGEWTRKG